MIRAAIGTAAMLAGFVVVEWSVDVETVGGPPAR